MFWRSAIKIAEWAGGILAGILLVAGGGAWLLSHGPLSLDWLAPYVATTFSQSQPGMTAQVDHTFISLGDGPSLEIIARGLHLKRTEGGAELALPQVSLSLSPQAALLGKIAPTRIALHGARLNLLRSADGSFHLGLAGERIGSNDWAETLLHELSHPPERNSAFGYLSEVRVTDAALMVDDRKLGVTWDAQHLAVTLRRGTDGFTGKVAMTIERGGAPAALEGDFEYAAAPHQLRTAMSFQNLRPSLYAAAAPALAPFAAFDLPLGGQISMTFDAETRHVTDFWCDLQLGQGRIVNDRLAGGELKIVRGTLRAVLDPKSQRLDLERFHAELNAPNGPKLDFAGSVFQFDPLATTPLDFTGHGKIQGVTMADLDQLWPEHAAFHAREWIMKHVLQGTVTRGDVSIAGTVLLGSSEGLVAKLNKVEGDLAYKDVSIQYFPPLAPVQDVAGTARFNRAEFDLFPDGGVSRDVKVTGGKVVLTKLDTDNEEATIDVTMTGPLTTVLDELNRKPLRYAKALGIEPADVKGTATGALHFHLPMKKDLRLSMVDYSARGTLEGLAIDKILFDRKLTADALRIAVDRGGVDLDGNAKLDGVPVGLDWKENFSGAPIRTKYRLQGVFDDSARHRLGIDWLTDMVSGPVGLDLTFIRHRNNFAESDATLDLTKSTLTIDRLGWTKKPGVPASAHLNIESRNDLSTRITGLNIHGGGLESDLDLTLAGSDTDAKIDHVNVYRLSVGQTDVSGTIARRPEGGWSVQIHGPTFDATRLMDDMQKATPSTDREPPLALEARLGQMVLSPGRVVRDVNAQLYSDGLHWRTAQIDAAPAPGKKLALRFGGKTGDGNFRLTSDDLGAVLNLLDISGKVRGGSVTVTARAEDRDGRRTLNGKIDGTNYRVVDAPAFAQLLSLASFTGPASLMNGRGIPFNRMQGDFVLDNGTVTLRNARAYGEAIGINASGQFDYRRNTLDMSGTLVPAYLLNSLLSNIPGIDFLLGGKGEGIFAAKFRVAGSAADPGISVNPLSALAPGFLRGLFLFDAGNPTQDNAKRDVPPKGG